MNSQLRTKKKSPITVYMAGDLWSHKDLVGNVLLADYVNKVSCRRYLCVLPQDLEEPVHRTIDIRNLDLKHVMTSDMAIFNFDGATLDPGTVVEFVYAKMLDIPCVILRTDFRAAGEGHKDQDPWNLMVSKWPRSKVVKLHGMLEYQNARKGASLASAITKLYLKMAGELVGALDEVRHEKPLVSNQKQLSHIYQWALQCPGSGYEGHFKPVELLQIMAAKKAKGLLEA